MKTSVILRMIGALSGAVANIPVHYKVTLSCDITSANYTGCLRGMHCTDERTCEKPLLNSLPYHQLFKKKSRPRSIGQLVKRALSEDGKCGPDNGDLLCDPKSTVYTGTCCSQYGWCGNTPAHCGNGCVSGCSNTVEGASSPTSSQEPVLGAPSTAPANGKDTSDGTCGAGNGNTVCGNWPQGACCSLYGFCGNTLAHCGDGCQSGPCNGAPAAPVPGPSTAPTAPNQGAFKIVGQAGVPAMHAGLLQNGRVVFLDKVENYTQITLADGQYAYSAEYDPATNTVVGLSYKTNAFCSGGTFLADGRFVSLGGNAPLTFIDPTVGDGFTAIRYLDRVNGANTGQSWSEPGNKLSSARWYASAQTLPDGTVFVASGSLNGLDPTIPANNNPTYEILNPEGISSGNSITLDILMKNQPYYMYPFIHLLSDSTLFIFVSKSAQIFNPASNNVVRELPDLQGDFRTYPNTGGSVLLPLTSANNWAPDILICGGGAYQDITSPTDPSCGRIQPLAANPTWELDSMPEGRGMVEGTLLPDGTVIWLNGCNRGAQGFGLGADSTLEALLYNPKSPLGTRFTTLASSTIARLYHSIAVLLLDGTLLIAGSNPVQQPVLQPVPSQVPSEDYVTEFRVEIFTPPYLSTGQARPTDIVLSTLVLKTTAGFEFTVGFTAPEGLEDGCDVVLYHGGFVTHSLHMGQRMLVLDSRGFVAGKAEQIVTVEMPGSGGMAPPGPYVVFVVCGGVPGVGQWVKVSG